MTNTPLRSLHFALSFSLELLSLMSSSSSSQVGGIGGSRRRRGREFERPSSSRQRSGNGVWPEPFVEALAYQVAVDAARTLGRRAAGPAIANVFQVCSTWRSASRYDHLWQSLTRRIWGRDRLLQETWRDEYVNRHRTACNFHAQRTMHSVLDIVAYDNDDDDLSCRCLALSDFHLACGLADGSVRLFDLTSRLHVSTFRPLPRDRLGRFSCAVSGIVLSGLKLVFASLDGDIHVAIIHGAGSRRAHMGNVVNDGVLVDFAGCSRWWVGLFAGVPERSFHVWDGETEELVFVGGSLTNQEAVMGWHMLTELTESIGRLRVSGQESAVACTGFRIVVFDLQNQGLILGVEEFERGVFVDSVDVSNETFLVVDSRGMASVRRVGSLEEVCRFRVRGGSQRRVSGCLNGGYAFLCAGGVIRVWDVEQGEYRYRLRERIGEPSALIADERYLAGCAADTQVHLWDFGAM